MNHKTYGFLSGAIFLVVSLAHLARLISGWAVTIAGFTAPMWISIPGLLVSGFLASWGFVLAFRTKSMS